MLTLNLANYCILLSVLKKKCRKMTQLAKGCHLRDEPESRGQLSWMLLPLQHPAPCQPTSMLLREHTSAFQKYRPLTMYSLATVSLFSLAPPKSYKLANGSKKQRTP